MREYGKVSPGFWIGETGRALRGNREAQIVAFYLLTSPHANMLGLYYLPIALVSHETGLPFEGASKGLRRGIEAGFCQYDEGTEMVWVMEMARFQIGERLDPADKRSRGVATEYANLPDCPFLPGFFDRYGEAFNLPDRRETTKPLRSPFEAPSKQGAGEGAGEGTGKAPPTPPALPEWIPGDAWDAWVEMRRKIKKPLATDRARALAINKLAELTTQGATAREVLEQSTLNGWQGLFPVNRGAAGRPASGVAASLGFGDSRPGRIIDGGRA